MNFLFLSRNKSHPPLSASPASDKSCPSSVANVNRDAPMDFKGIRIWAFANDQDMGLEGTMLHSNYLHLFVFRDLLYWKISFKAAHWT